MTLQKCPTFFFSRNQMIWPHWAHILPGNMNLSGGAPSWSHSPSAQHSTMVRSLESGPTLPIWSWPGISYPCDCGQVTFISFHICEMGMITSSNLEVGWGLSKWIRVKLSRECLVSNWDQARLGIIIYLLVLVCTWVCHPWFRRWNFKNIVGGWGQEDPPLSMETTIPGVRSEDQGNNLIHTRWCSLALKSPDNSTFCISPLPLPLKDPWVRPKEGEVSQLMPGNPRDL